MTREPNPSVVEQIFNAALDVKDPDERASYIKDACGEDIALRREVEELVAHHESGFLDSEAKVDPWATVSHLAMNELAETNQTQSFVQAQANERQSIILKVTGGSHAGQTFAFAQHDTFLVGRSKKAHFCLPEKDPFFSRLHFLIEVNPPLCRLVDLKSHNGTLVNGQKVDSIELKDGDEIRGGTTTLLVHIRSPIVEDIYATAPPPKGPESTKSSHEFPPIPGYRISKELGRGGMGVVYRAERESDGRDVALKTIIPKVRMGHDSLKRFVREANILSQLRHPNIVAFQDVSSALKA